MLFRSIACADMLLKGEGTQVNNIFFGSTISNDGFPKEEFDFMLSNPPFGTSWKAELKAWGDIKKDEITDPRFIIDYDGNPEYTLLPDIGDPQMLFLANNISKMKQKTSLGSRIIEVHNSSSLFNGNAGSGTSNLRRYIIENDLLEAIVALPEKMFYNTDIGTFLWIVTNKKEEKRKGKVQLIDATTMKSSLKKNIGEKNSEITPDIRRRILEIYLAFDEADSKYSKVFENAEFGYYAVDVQRPLRLSVDLSEENISEIEAKDSDLARVLMEYTEQAEANSCADYNEFIERVSKIADNKNIKMTAKRKKLIRDILTNIDETAAPVKDAKGNLEADKNLKDTEQVPMTYPGGIDGYWENEVRPYAQDSWIESDSASIGYELSFTKYFYKPVEVRSAEDIILDIQSIEKDTDGLLAAITGGMR